MRGAAVHNVLVLVLGCFLIGHAAAQKAQPSADLMAHFYKDPRPERLAGFLKEFGAARDWGAYPPLVGFYAVVFRAQPGLVDKLVPEYTDGKLAQTVAAALRLSGQEAKTQSVRSRLSDAGSDPKLQSELAGLPSRVEDLQIATLTHLDILWGASFADGDSRHALKIIDFFARTANRSEPIALDVAHTALAIMGGPKDILRQLKDKYGETLTKEIVYAATALWGVSSNAQQHEFVDKAVTAYIQEHPGSHAAKALQALRSKKRAASISPLRPVARAV